MANATGSHVAGPHAAGSFDVLGARRPGRHPLTCKRIHSRPKGTGELDAPSRKRPATERPPWDTHETRFRKSGRPAVNCGPIRCMPPRRVTSGNGRSRPTIIQVAQAAGVSPATVSRVLSGAVPVSPDLTARVRQAVDHSGYRPNPIAQGLLRGTTHSVGVVVPDLTNPYFAEVLKGVTAAASEHGYRTIVSDADEEPTAEADLALELAHWADGVVLCSPRMSDRSLTRLSRQLPRLVIVNRIVRGRRLPTVVVDFHAGMAALCEHLRSLGHRRLVYLCGPRHAWSERERQRGLRDAEGSGLQISQLPCGSTAEDGYRVAADASRVGATAIVAFSDHVAFGTLTRLRELGIRVPEDLSLTGFDDVQFSQLTSPPLTTVRIVKTQLGRLAWEQFEDGNSPRARRQSTILHPELVARGSTGPPKAAP